MESNISYTSLMTLPSGGQMQRTMGNHQLVIISQLLRVASQKRDIDELLFWLGHALIARLDLEAIQFWAQGDLNTEKSKGELRVMACRNSAQPQLLVHNPKIIELADQALAEQRGTYPQTTYPAFFATPYRKQQLNYWFSHYLSTSWSIPQINHTEQATSTQRQPLRMLLVVFTAEHPTPRLLPTISNILEQALQVAGKQRLLDPAQEIIPIRPRLPENVSNTLPLMELIPRKILEHQEGEYETIALSSTIRNRQARRLYLAIDGRHTISSLSALLQLHGKTLWQALNTLVLDRYIQFQNAGEAAGKSIHILATL